LGEKRDEKIVVVISNRARVDLLGSIQTRALRENTMNYKGALAVLVAVAALVAAADAVSTDMRKAGKVSAHPIVSLENKSTHAPPRNSC